MTEDGKIVHIFSNPDEHAWRNGEPVPTVVELAELVLEDARSGKIQSLAVVALDNQNSGISQVRGRMNIFNMLGSLVALTYRFLVNNVKA